MFSIAIIIFLFFFFNAPPTNELYTLSLHDALPICVSNLGGSHSLPVPIVRLNEFFADNQEISKGVIVNQPGWEQLLENNKQDRKSTRLNSSHGYISYAVFCLKKKKKKQKNKHKLIK